MFKPLTTGLVILAACGLGHVHRNLMDGVRAKQPELDACYEEALARDPATPRDVETTLRIEETEGRVVDVEYEDLRHSPFRRCLTDTLLTVRVTPNPEVDIDFDTPLRLGADSPSPSEPSGD